MRADGSTSRSLLWADFLTADAMGVSVDGREHDDGTTEVAVSVYVGDGQELDGTQARTLAAALLDAADLLDALR